MPNRKGLQAHYEKKKANGAKSAREHANSNAARKGKGKTKGKGNKGGGKKSKGPQLLKQKERAFKVSAKKMKEAWRTYLPNRYENFPDETEHQGVVLKANPRAKPKSHSRQGDSRSKSPSPSKKSARKDEEEGGDAAVEKIRKILRKLGIGDQLPEEMKAIKTL